MKVGINVATMAAITIISQAVAALVDATGGVLFKVGQIDFIGVGSVGTVIGTSEDNSIAPT